MNATPFFAAAALALVCSTESRAQDALLLRADGAGLSSLHRLENGAATIVVPGVALAPLELVGVARRERYLVDRPRAVSAAGVIPAHVRLPDGSRLWRGQQSGAGVFLRLGPGTQLRELVSLSPGQVMLGTIAISLDGRDAGVIVDDGSLRHAVFVDLDTGSATWVAADDALPTSVRVRDGIGWFATNSGTASAVVLASGVVVEGVLPLVAGESVLAEVAVADDGSRLAVVVERASGARRILSMTSAGTVDVVTQAAGDYDTPSYDDGLGPFLVVSPDGSSIACRRTTPAVVPYSDVIVHECAAATVSNYTADGLFTDTLNDVGVISFVAPGILSFLVGERSTEVGVLIEAVDCYAAQVMPDGTPGVLANLTATSNDAAVPFLEAGTLEVLDIVLDPRGEQLLWAVDPQGADGELLASPVGSTGAPQVLMNKLESPPALVATGDTIIASALADEDFHAPGTLELHVIPPAGVGAPTHLGFIPSGIDVDRYASSPDGTQLALVVSAGPALELGVVVDVTLGLSQVLTPSPFAWSPSLGYASSGELMSALGAPGSYIVVAWDGPSVATKVALPVGRWQVVDLY